MATQSLSTNESFFSQKYFPSLDGLRALSIIPVVWHHATPYVFEGVLGRGAIGVDLFFAISGFLITTLLVRERASVGQIDLPAFYARRAFRIFPLYYLVLGLNVAFALWIQPNWAPSQRFLARSPYYAAYVANWQNDAEFTGPALFVFAWSLCTEEQFYAFWAPLLRLVRRLRYAALAMSVCVVVDLALEALGRSRACIPHPLFSVLTSFSTPIGVGALVALVVHHPRWGKPIAAVSSHSFAVPIALVFVSSLVVWPWAPVVVLHLALGGLVLVCATRKRHALMPVLEHPSLRYVGKVSYGIYLWHVAVLGALKALVPSLQSYPTALFAIGLPLSILVAGLSYRFFEEPFLRQGRKWRRIPQGLPMSHGDAGFASSLDGPVSGKTLNTVGPVGYSE